MKEKCFSKKKKQFRIGILVVLILLFTGNIHALAEGDFSVEDSITEFKQKTKCESASVVVCQGEDIAYYGDADPAKLYQIGSMTKAFTGLAVMKLIEEGRILPSGRVSDYISGFSVYYENKEVDITINDLLCHTSGFTNSEKDYPSADENMTLTDWVQCINGKALTYAPGAQYSYSNVNYNLLGALIEKVTGKSYREYMEQEILQPLGLGNTYVGTPPDTDRIISGSRLGCRRTYAFSQPVKEGAIPAGYFYSTIEDMGRWLQIWLGSADIPATYKAVIEKTKELLARNSDCYAGWETCGNGAIGHSGGTAGYSSRIVYSLASPVGVCVLTNLNVAASTDRLCNDIYAALTGAEPNGYVQDVWTIFDGIFTGITICGLLVICLSIYGRRHTRALLCFDVTEAILLVCMLVIIPLIFQASWQDILFIWAPWSMLGGMLVLGMDVITLTIMIGIGKHANHNKKSRESTADHHC